MTDRPRSGAKAVTWDWELMNLLYTDEECCVKLTEKQVAFLLTPLVQAGWSTRWFNRPANFQDIEAFVADVQLALTACVSCDSGNGSNGSSTRYVAGIGGGFSDDCDIDDCEGENMACGCKPVYMNGGWFIPLDCGCDGIKYFALGSPVNFDANGNPVPITDGGEFGGAFENNGTYGVWDGNVTAGNITCYGTAATDYLLDRAKSFFYAVLDFATVGDEIEKLYAGEDINFFALIPALLFGNPELEYIRALSKPAIDAMLSDTAMRTQLIEGWEFTGSVNRDQLQKWVARNTPITVQGFTASVMLTAWLGYSLILGYNDDLIKLAAACQSESTIPVNPFPDAEWGQLFDFTDTIVDPTKGWFAGTGSQAQFNTGIGWSHNTSASQDGSTYIHYPPTTAIVGMRLYLDAIMTGDNPRCTLKIGNDGFTSNIAQVLGASAVYTITYTGSDHWGLFIAANDDLSNPVLSVIIQKVEMFGTGTRPADGVAIF